MTWRCLNIYNSRARMSTKLCLSPRTAPFQLHRAQNHQFSVAARGGSCQHIFQQTEQHNGKFSQVKADEVDECQIDVDATLT